MNRILYGVTVVLLSFCGGLWGDGLLVPSAPEYPKDLLRNRSTRVEVRFDGLVARTSAYQEFVNEWDRATDAVYSFPLPAGARATNFVYWDGDRAFQAVMEVREQATNPGTGEGGPAAEINRYLAVDGIKIELKDIPPGGIQRVRLDYIEVCPLVRGRCTYRYPLDTGDFVTHAIDQLEFSVKLRSGADITAFDLPDDEDFVVVESGPRTLELKLERPKAFLNRDITFYYDVAQEDLGLDFYSTAGLGEPGHFALFVRPPNNAAPDEVLPRRVFFLLSNSSRMFGARLTQTVAAINRGLDLLTERDQFNVVLFGTGTRAWQDGPVAATAANKDAARDFLEGVESFFGTRLDRALEEALGQVADDRFANAIVAFTDGRTPIDPRQIAAANRFATGIFPVAIGDDVDRARLELTAALNRGFVTYMDDEDNLRQRMDEVIDQLSQPVLANTFIEYGRGDVDQILPLRLPTTYAGRAFLTVGRYRQPGAAELSVSGLSVDGIVAFNTQLDFEARADRNRFARLLWARQALDAVEGEIAVYGEDEAGDLRARAIDLSLTYNLRSRFTALIADYQTAYVPTAEEEGLGLIAAEQVDLGEPTAVLEEEDPGVSYLAGNFPNPFNATTTLRLFLGAGTAGRIKMLKLYNVLGQLVDIVDLSGLAPGWHTVQLDAVDFFGQPLATGLYFVQLHIDGRPVDALRVQLLR